MQQAKVAGIDAFALNIGTDTYTETQLNHAYQSAADNGVSVFISFDFNLFTTSMTSEIGQIIKKFGSQPGQLKVDGKVFISSFLGDGLDLDAVASASGYARTDLFFAPNFQPTNAGSADALFNWMAWPNNGNNKAPDGSNNLTVSDGDQTYVNALGGKPYVAPVSAWFSTHLGLEVPYSKNWVFPSDLLWFRKSFSRVSCSSHKPVLWLEANALAGRQCLYSNRRLHLPLINPICGREKLMLYPNRALDRNPHAIPPIPRNHHLERLRRIPLHRSPQVPPPR